MKDIVLTPAVMAPDDLTDVEGYVGRYLTFGKKTVESLLFMTETVYEAKAEFSKDHRFVVFCDRVGIDPGGATCNKMTTIGKATPVLLPYAYKLPRNWTTLYKIAKLPEPERVTVLESERLNPETTAKELDEIVEASERSNPENTAKETHEIVETPESTTIRSQQGPTILLDLTGLGASEIDEVELEIANLESRFGKSLKVTRIGFSARYPEKHFFQMEINGTIPQLKGGAVHA